MATRKIPGRGSGDRVPLGRGPARLRVLLGPPAVAAAAAALAACSSSATSSTSSAPSSPGSSSAAAEAAGSLKTAKVGGVTVLASSTGFTLYSFAPDTPTTSKCNGTCA